MDEGQEQTASSPGPWLVGPHDFTYIYDMITTADDNTARSEIAAFAARLFARTEPSATVVSLERFGLTPVHSGILAECFRSRLGTLRSLTLSYNELGDAGLEPVFHALLGASRIASLILNKTSLRGENTPSLFALIKNSATLRDLDLSQNLGSDVLEQNLGPALAANSSLVWLCFNYTSISTTVLLRHLWVHPRLRMLNMDRCASVVSQPWADEIAQLLKHNHVLRTFSMGCIPCPSASMRVIVESLFYNTGLAYLHIEPYVHAGSQAYEDVRLVLLNLLDEHITLCTIPFADFELDRKIGWNKQRKHSRLGRARSVFVVLEGIRRFRRAPVLSPIPKDIMNFLGQCIMATGLHPAWQDPDLRQCETRPVYNFCTGSKTKKLR